MPSFLNIKAIFVKIVKTLKPILTQDKLFCTLY
jgi:hypothetical protein